MEKVLILGGSYFIGKHVTNKLKDSYDIYVLNRGTYPIKDDKIKHLIGDRNEPSQIKEALKDFNFNHIVDISGYNTKQLTHVLDVINKEHLKSYVFISTSAVYDIHKNTAPFKEDDALGGESPFKKYAKDKIECETLLFNTLSASQITIFRPPFVYGPDNYIYRERLMFMLIEKDEEIFIPESNNVISFVYVKDLASNVLEAIQKIIPAGIYNVGNQEAITFSKWVSLCESAINQKANVTFLNAKQYGLKTVDYFPYFDYDNVLDVSKIKQYSKTETPILEGLKMAYKDYLSIKNDLEVPSKIVSSYQKIQALKNLK